jgi:hypothetical protein
LLGKGLCGLFVVIQHIEARVVAPFIAEAELEARHALVLNA